MFGAHSRAILPFRAVTAACLLVFTLCAPSLVVCEGTEHTATEWFFATCCPLPGDAGGFSTGCPTDVRTGQLARQAGGCACECTDKPLLGSTLDVSAALHGWSSDSFALIPRTILPSPLVKPRIEPAASVQLTHLQPGVEFSTVLLI